MPRAPHTQAPCGVLTEGTEVRGRRRRENEHYIWYGRIPGIRVEKKSRMEEVVLKSSPEGRFSLNQLEPWFSHIPPCLCEEPRAQHAPLGLNKHIY